MRAAPATSELKRTEVNSSELKQIPANPSKLTPWQQASIQAATISRLLISAVSLLESDVRELALSKTRTSLPRATALTQGSAAGPAKDFCRHTTLKLTHIQHFIIITKTNTNTDTNTDTYGNTNTNTTFTNNTYINSNTNTDTDTNTKTNNTNSIANTNTKN